MKRYLSVNLFFKLMIAFDIERFCEKLKKDLFNQPKIYLLRYNIMNFLIKKFVYF